MAAKVTPRSGSNHVPVPDDDHDDDISVNEIAEELMSHSHPVPTKDAKVAFGEPDERISLANIRKNSSKRKSMIQLLDLIDKDGDGYLEANELLETIKILKNEKGKVRKLKYTVIGLIFVVVISFAMMLVTSVLGSELAKDQMPDDTGVLMTKSGQPVKTEVTSMHLTLMDIPKFGREQLSKLHTIDLDTSVGLMSLQITGYLAQQGKHVTLFTSMAGTEVMIDAQAGTAAVSLKGETVVVKTGTEQITRRALLADKAEARCFSNGACMFERHELQQLFGTHDANGRRLQGTDSSYSFVTINTADLSTEQSLDALISEASNSIDSETVYGTANAGDIEIKFEQIAGTNRIQAALGNMRWLHTDIASYTFDGMDLVGCDDAGSFFPNVASVLNQTVDADVEFKVTAKYTGSSPADTFIVPTPDDAECQQLFMSQYPDIMAAAAESDVPGRRLMPDGTHEHALHHGHAQMLALNNHIKMFSQDPDSAQHLQFETEKEDAAGRKLLVAAGTINSFANMGQDVYNNGGCPSTNYGGWRCSDYRASGNAYAWYVTNGNQCGFVVRGSDDLQDWISNLVGAFSRSNACGANGCVSVHRGFNDEFNKLKPFFQEKINGGCTNPHWSGHSLGGAVASIADYVFGGTSVVFASPKPFASKVNVNEYRLFHEDDAVSGKMFGFMSSLDHGGGTVKQIVCGKQKCRWWGWSCSCVKWKIRGAGSFDDSGTWDNPFSTLPAHSIGNMVWALVRNVWDKWGR